MDRNSVIGFVLIVAILAGYMWYSMPTAEQEAEEALNARKTEVEQRAKAEGSIPSTVIVDGDTLDADSVQRSALSKRYGIFEPSAQGDNRSIVIENERLHVSISTQGAKPSVIQLKEYRTNRQTPLILADPDSGIFEFRFFLGNLDISTKDLFFSAEKLGSTGVRLTANTTETGKKLQITYQLDPETSVQSSSAWKTKWTPATRSSTGTS